MVSNPRFKLKKVLLSLILVSAGFSHSVNADNAMRNIFNGMMTSTSPASFETATRTGVVGGSFSYRQTNVNTNLVSMSFPKASVGCNGIDVFLGSFSMINGDQLVQVARGIAQGAAIYAFNVAVSAICADCAATINDIQNKLNALNKFAKDSCNATYSFLAETSGPPDRLANDISSGPASLYNSLSGVFSDFGTSFTKKPETITSQAKAKDPVEFAEKFSGNLFYMAFMNIDKGSMNIGGVTELSGYKLAEQLMSLVGTIIVSWDDKGERAGLEIRPSTMTVTDYIMGPPKGGTVKMLKCAPAPDPKLDRKAQCLTMQEVSDGGFIGLKQTVTDLLEEVQKKVKSNVEVTDDELRIMSFIGIPTILQTFDVLEFNEGYAYIQDISSVATTNLVINMLQQVDAKITSMNIPSEALASRKADLNSMIANLNKQIKAAYDLTYSQVGSGAEIISVWDDRRLKRMAFLDSMRSMR
ncbi:conjugal transfer protein TraH [Escherichia coli]|nr:conjugal transfer protein TraH [Escherichia coli]